MADPQGSTTLNTAWIDSVIAQVNAIQSCGGLQGVVDDAMGSLSAVKAAIEAEMAAIAPILALLTAPGANLSALATWIGNYISHVLAPQYAPYTTYVTQLTLLITKVGQLTAAIAAAEARILNCSITIPAL
jgi:hypothetical protein